MLNRLANGLPSPTYTVVTADADGVQRTDVFQEWWNDGKCVEDIHRSIEDQCYGEHMYDKGYWKLISCERNPLKICINGGRDFDNEDLMQDTLEGLYLDATVELISGMAKCAELLAYNLFKANGLKYYEYPADWKDLTAVPCVIGTNQYGQYNKLAGHNRNHTMGDDCDVLLSFWNGKSTGTKELQDYMNKLGKPVIIVRY